MSATILKSDRAAFPETDSGSAFIGPDCAGVRMSPEEFDAIDDTDETYNYELIHGVLVVSPPPLEEERDANEELGHWLRDYRTKHPQGVALDKTLSEQTIKTAENRRRADRVIWAGLGRKPRRNVDVPSIVVEFVSAGRRSWYRDYVEKRDEYLALGVREYWVIDRFSRSMIVVRQQPEGVVHLKVAEHDIYRTDLLPGFELPLAKLLAVADEWGSNDRDSRT